jgi:hypothetical protein
MQSRQEILVGLSISLTGKFSVQGRQALDGLRLWQSYVNGRDGINLGQEGPRRVRVVFYDDQSLASLARENALRLLRQDRVDALFGPYSSGLAMTGAEVAHEHERSCVEPRRVVRRNLQSRVVAFSQHAHARKGVFARPSPLPRATGTCSAQDLYRTLHSRHIRHPRSLGSCAGGNLRIPGGRIEHDFAANLPRCGIKMNLTVLPFEGAMDGMEHVAQGEIRRCLGRVASQNHLLSASPQQTNSCRNPSRLAIDCFMESLPLLMRSTLSAISTPTPVHSPQGPSGTRLRRG